MRWKDRVEAGRGLAAALFGYRRPQPVAVAMSRGAVPVAYGVAAGLDCDLEVMAGGRPSADVAGRAVILVDDGTASPGAVADALRALQRQGAALAVLAAPVLTEAAEACCRELTEAVVSLDRPVPTFTPAAWYRAPEPPTDAELVELLEQARPQRGEDLAMRPGGRGAATAVHA